MKVRNLVAMFAVGALATAAWALCPPEKGATDQKASDSKVELTAAKSGCCDKAKQAETVSGDSPCPHAKGAQTASQKPACCDKAKGVETATQKPGCCDKAKGAQTASAGSGCSKSAAVQTASTGSGCSKPCGAAQTASTGSGCSKPCGAAQTASTGSGCSKPCGAAQTASTESGCPKTAKVTAVLASLPSMSFKVGEKTTGCSKSAAAMAEESGSKMQYVVGEQTFDAEGDAVAQLAKLLEDEAAKMQTIQFAAGGKCYQCPVTAKSMAGENGGQIAYRVGGVDFETKAQAEKALENIKVALAKVEMGYKVGDKSGATAGEAGDAKLTYVVGDQETCCKIQAGAMLAQAKVRTIVEAALQTL